MQNRYLGLVVTILLIGATTPGNANQIERACLKADRATASRALCGCIQDVADQTLRKTDQKLAASFFKDPARAQEIRQSDARRYEAFWKRYKSFGQTAQRYCAGSRN